MALSPATPLGTCEISQPLGAGAIGETSRAREIQDRSWMRSASP